MHANEEKKFTNSCHIEFNLWVLFFFYYFTIPNFTGLKEIKAERNDLDSLLFSVGDNHSIHSLVVLTIGKQIKVYKLSLCET